MGAAMPPALTAPKSQGQFGTADLSLARKPAFHELKQQNAQATAPIEQRGQSNGFNFAQQYFGQVWRQQGSRRIRLAG